MKFIDYIHSKNTFPVYLPNVTLLFRSSFRDEFWEKYAFWSIEKIPVKSPCLQPYLKNELFQLFFKDFNQFYFCWDIDFFLVSSFYFPFIEKTLHWIFWKCYSLFLHAVYQCEHVLCKLGELPHFGKIVFFEGGGGGRRGTLPLRKMMNIPAPYPQKINKCIGK